ncbi:ribonuclease P protein component [Bacteroides coprosuis]|uniref:ribonuclease P protein component n=1 Tax=Bacteroides coprosuis TaxID=151276 RepID=UPI001D1FE744|nr:ribonuclease P protein component [Bacteroides coprosuis]HJD93108.1 ribonuclease P protein component [Bacteroides coprosuis]
MGKKTFKRQERIKSKKIIDYLFCGGAKSFSIYPIRVVYKEHPMPEATNTSILVSVSKKRHKHAVDRNRVKRLLRESFRTNKNIILDKLSSQNKHLAIAFIYLSTDIYPFDEIESRMKKILMHISEEFDS